MNEKPVKTSVLIVGAGPSGLLLACQLAMHKVNFIIIEKRIRKQEFSGALVIHPSTLEIFSQLNMLDEVLEKAVLINSLNFNWNNKKFLTFNIIEKGKGHKKLPQIILLKQFLLEQILVEHLEKLGHTVHIDNELTEYASTGNAYIATVRKATTDTFTINCNYIIGADGKDSTVRTIFNFPVVIRKDNNPLFVMDFNGSSPSQSGEMSFIFNKIGSFGIFPLDNDLIRLDGSIRMNLPYNNLSAGELFRYFPKNTGVTLIKWFSVFYSNYSLAKVFSKANVFLVGDAAHTHNPVGGQGMNSGFQDAINLGWKLAYVIKNNASPKILDTYTYERRPVVKKIIRTSNIFYWLITSKNPVVSYIWLQLIPTLTNILSKLLQLRSFRNLILNSISQYWIQYKSNLVIPKRFGLGVKPGTIMKTSLIPRELQSSTNFKLFILSEKEISMSSNFLNDFPVDYRLIIKDKDNCHLFETLKIKKGRLYLIRPDNYVALCSKDLSDKKMKKQIGNYFKFLKQ